MAEEKRINRSLSFKGLYKVINDLAMKVDNITKDFAGSIHKHLCEDITDLHPVAKSGNWNDVENKPFIPTDTQDLFNGAKFIIKEDIPIMAGASAGSDGHEGIVAKPIAGEQDNALCGDGKYHDTVPYSGALRDMRTGTPITAQYSGSEETISDYCTVWGSKDGHYHLGFEKWENIMTMIIPIGTILPLAGRDIPKGYLLCDGREVSRTTYAALFQQISVWYGAGNGSTTFNLPNLMDNRFMEFGSYSDLSHKKEAGLPNITGSGAGFLDRESSSIITGAFYQNGTGYTSIDSQSWAKPVVALDASRASSVYGKSSTVQPKSLMLRAIIKY